MAQVIMIIQNPTLKDLVSVNLNTYLGAQIIPRNTAAEAIALMEILPSVDLIITDGKVAKEDTAKDIWKACKKNKLDTGMVVLGECPEDIRKDVQWVENALDWEKVVDSASRVLGITLDDLKKKLRPEYAVVPLDYFYSLPSSPCDVFIRIKGPENEYQFLKRIHAGESFDQTVLERYKSQGLLNLYIPKEMRDNFAVFLSNILIQKLEEGLVKDQEDYTIIGQTFDLARMEIVAQGLNRTTIQLADTVISSISETAVRSKTMGPVLQKILGSKTGFLYQNAQLTTMVAYHILKGLGKDSEELKIKIAYAAFFCDVALLEREDLAQFDSYQEFDQAVSENKIKKSDFEVLKNHPLEGAVFIRKNPEAPIDVDLIIRQHHGDPKGSGFSHEHYDEILEVSRIFILAESFARRVLSYRKGEGNPRPVILDMREKFSQVKSMAPLVVALEKSLKNSQES